MARRLVLLILISVSLTSCMEMKETVERMVMVRTTGSDLQPAATGFIYKRNSDGPAKVIKMGEDEILEELKKLPETIYEKYEQPKAFAAPLPAAVGPFYAKEADESKAAAYVIPVVEKVDEDEEKGDGKIDGIADEDYGKILGEYAADQGEYKSDFSDYLHGYGDYDKHAVQGDEAKDGAYDKHAAEKDEEADNSGDGNKGYASSQKYGNGKAGDYHMEKHESFSVSSKGGDAKAYTDSDAAKKENDDGHAKSEEAGGFRQLHPKSNHKEDGSFYDEESLPRGFGKISHGHGYFGSDARGYQADSSHDAGFDEDGTGYLEHQPDQYDFFHGDDESSHHKFGDYGDNRGYSDGKGYGFEVKHRR